MPFTVQDLVEDQAKPVVIERGESAQKALQLMIENDFSQLPVVDADGRKAGMITSDSIIRALNHFDLTIKEMRVSHAMTEAVSFRLGDDLFGLLDDLKDTFAVLVMDREEKVIGIITSYDTTEYFRRRGEDIMLVEDIETMLRDYILAAFQNEAGETDQVSLDAAIGEIMPSNAAQRGGFQKALGQYLQGKGDADPQIDDGLAAKAFEQNLYEKAASKDFHLLTLDEFIKLFLHRSRWDRYQVVLGLDAAACRKLLEAVRNTRNELAHFRADLTPQQRDELRFCKDWLARHQSDVIDAFRPQQEPGKEPKTSDQATPPPSDNEGARSDWKLLVTTLKDWTGRRAVLPPQLIERQNSYESRYVPLALYLQSQPPGMDKVDLSFNDVESIIDGDLPRYARQHRSWWANDSVGHVQSQQWLDAGWKVSLIDMPKERVTFSRMKEREQAHIRFYNQLLTDLRGRGKFPVRVTSPDRVGSPDGRSWLTIADAMPEEGAPKTFLGCAFARGRNFRVELYLDERETGTGGTVYDELHRHENEIEDEFGEQLSWESFNDGRARIALYGEGAVTAEEDRLAALRDWAVDNLIRFHEVFAPRIQQIVAGNRSGEERNSSS